MSSLVPVPHRAHLPTTQLGNSYDIRPHRESDSFERALDICNDEFMAYAGRPDIQNIIAQEALDDVLFHDEVTLAAERIHGTAKVTNVSRYEGISIKNETEQPTKAYKVRGATNFILKYAVKAHEAGVVTASAGNHGQAVALAAAKLGIEAMVVVPEGTPLTKINGIKEQGGRVFEYGSDYAAASQKAYEINERQHGLFVPAFNHRDIMAGQATIGLELVGQLQNMTDLIVPTGGGGLVAGLAKYLRVAAPSVKVYAAGISNGSAVETAFKRGNSGHTVANRFADGIAVDQLGDITWTEIKRHVAGVFTVEDLDVRRLIGTMSLNGHVLEGAGAVGLASALAHRGKLGRHPATVTTGGNIDAEVLQQCKDLVTPAPRQELTETTIFSTI